MLVMHAALLNTGKVTTGGLSLTCRPQPTESNRELIEADVLATSDMSTAGDISHELLKTT